jgi:hypothetical protein
MTDDIAYWKHERAKLQEQLNELETEAVQKASLLCVLSGHQAACH